MIEFSQYTGPPFVQKRVSIVPTERQKTACCIPDKDPDFVLLNEDRMCHNVETICTFLCSFHVLVDILDSLASICPERSFHLTANKGGILTA